ncbi:asparagine synthase (glutamine-hydrolyzing) [Pseudomonadota bacterium]
MCGITGWFSKNKNGREQLPNLQGMVDAIAHRGPDGQGLQLNPHAALGHTRLSIIDLAGGDQPMNSHDNRYSIIFNGEIYNYKHLKTQLEAQGHQFKTHSDTEVILELYRAKGLSGFNLLRGMYAFALWDHQQETGLLVRDPLGIKPLFIQKNNEGISFGSEAKSILARHDHCGELDLASLHLLLNFRYLPGEHSLFQGITQLAPGSILEWAPNAECKHHLIQPETCHQSSTIEALRESVGAHFTADVEVGAYLSGGIDSASIVSLGKTFTPNKLRTFTLQAGDDPNEAKYAARSAEILNVDNIQGAIDTDLDGSLSKLIWHLETPKINALQINQIAQLASKHVKVVLSGLGGDELFLGYNAHKIILKAANTANLLPSALNGPMGGLAAGIIETLSKPVWSEPERAFRMLQSLGNWPRVYGLLRNVWDSPKLRQQIYGPKMLDAVLPNAFDAVEERWPSDPDPVSAMAKFEWRNKMVNDLLWQEDRCSMAVGLESRTPFVDTQFASHVQALSRQTLMPNNRPKGYMKEIISQQVSQEILARPKSGFQISSPDFYHQHLKSLGNRLLTDEAIRRHGLFNPSFVKNILSQPPKKGLRWHYFMLYFMLMTHLWIEVFEHRNGKPAYNNRTS